MITGSDRNDGILIDKQGLIAALKDKPAADIQAGTPTLSVVAACSLIYTAKLLKCNVRMLVEVFLPDCMPSIAETVGIWLPRFYIHIKEQVSCNKKPANEFVDEVLSKVIKHTYKNNYQEQKVMLCTADNYPRSLKEIGAYPAILFYESKLRKLDVYNVFPSLCIVGSRKMTAYGAKVITQLVAYLSMFNVQIVSGLAYGCDIKAHRESLANDLIPIAVLPNSLDCCYPREHENYLAEIKNKGIVFSEFMPNTSANAGYFAARNRLLSALSQVCVVIESGRSGGSLITAAFAIKQNRELFVVPGMITQACSQGCNNLILEGASPYLRPEQLAETIKELCRYQDYVFELKYAHVPLFVNKPANDSLLKRAGVNSVRNSAAAAEFEVHADSFAAATSAVENEINLSALICGILETQGYMNHEELFMACKDAYADRNQIPCAESFTACLQLLEITGKIKSEKAHYYVV